MRPHRRGYTTAEVLIASFLSAILSAIVAVTLVSTTRTTRQTVEDTRLQQEDRALSDVLGQFLRSAKPLGECLDEESGVNSESDTCRVIKEKDHPFLAATSSTLEFFSYTNAAASSGEGFAPDLVKVSVAPAGTGCKDDGCHAVTVTLYCNSNVLDGAVCAAPSTGSLSYTDQSALEDLRARTPRSSRTIYVSNPTPFSFLDTDAVSLCSTGTCSSDDLADIAVVKVLNTAPSQNENAPDPQPLLIPLPSRGFRD